MSDAEKSRVNYQNYRYCFENGHQEWLVKAFRCMQFWRGAQWEAGDRAKLERAQRPALTLNVIESLVRVMKGTQRMLRNDVRFAPVSDANADDAKVRDALWLHFQNQNSMEFLETEVYERGLITGRAYYDIRASFGKNLQGDVKISKLRSQDVVLDPCIDDYDPQTWPQVYTARWANLLDIKEKFGEDAAEELRNVDTPQWYDYDDIYMAHQLGGIPYYATAWRPDIDKELVRALRVLSRQYYILKDCDVFVDMQTGDTSDIPDSWDRERVQRVLQTIPGLNTMRRKIRKVRWLITCENVVLHDDDSPYDRFTIVPYFPTFLDGVTIGAVEGLIDPQMLYNKVTSQELHIINTTANSGWKTKVGNIKNMTREQLETAGAQTGLVLEVEDVAQTEKIQPNQVPAAHDRLSMKADSIMRSLSGVSQQARGFAREDVAGEAILMNQAAADINFAAPLANLHRSKQLVAMAAMECAKAYMTDTRVIMINRGSTYRPEFSQVQLNQPSVEGRVINDITKGEYTTVLVPSPARTLMTEDEFKQMIMLRKELGINIPDAVMIELSNAPNKGEIIQQIQGSSGQAQQQQRDQEAHEQELELNKAKINKEQSAAQLNAARAQKAAGEASRDPDAAYKQVEMTRIQFDKQAHDDKMGIDRAKLALQRREVSHKTAIDLTRIDHETLRHRQKMAVDREKIHAKPKTPPKKAGASR